MRKLFGTDGVRGTANTHPMTAEMALRIGAAVGRYFRRDATGVHRVVIGKDTRLSGYMFENALTAGVLMTAINLTAMTFGYALGKAMRLPFPQVASITFEVGVQNLSLALFVAFTFLQSPELAIATLVYALVMKITAMSFVAYVRKRLGGDIVTERVPVS